jgi:hypothetical protein
MWVSEYYVCVLLGGGGVFFGVCPVAVINKIKYQNILYILVYVTNMYITCKSVYIYKQRTDNDYDKWQTRPLVRGGARNR